MTEDEYLESLIEADPLYPAFLAFIKKKATKILSIKSLINRFEIMRTLRNNYFFAPLNPDLPTTIGAMQNAGLGAVSMNLYLWVIEKWLEFRHISPSDEDVPWLSPKKGPRKREISAKDLLTPFERAQIQATLEVDSVRAYLATMWDTAGRPSEPARMNLKDVEQDQHGFVLNLHQTKYKKRLRPVRLLDPHSMSIFYHWLNIHPHLKQEDLDAPLFINRKKARVKSSSVTETLRSSFNKRFHRGPNEPRASLNCYLYRKSRITYLLKEEMLTPIQIKTRIGHAKYSNVLEKYYAILDEMDQAQAELRYLGVMPKSVEAQTSIPCSFCEIPNLITDKYCFKCGRPLTQEVVVEQHQKTLQEAWQTLLEDPEKLQTLADALSSLIDSGDSSDQSLPEQTSREE